MIEKTKPTLTLRKTSLRTLNDTEMTVIGGAKINNAPTADCSRDCLNEQLLAVSALCPALTADC